MQWARIAEFSDIDARRREHVIYAPNTTVQHTSALDSKYLVASKSDDDIVLKKMKMSDWRACLTSKWKCLCWASVFSLNQSDCGIFRMSFSREWLADSIQSVDRKSLLAIGAVAGVGAIGLFGGTGSCLSPVHCTFIIWFVYSDLFVSMLRWSVTETHGFSSRTCFAFRNRFSSASESFWHSRTRPNVLYLNFSEILS